MHTVVKLSIGVSFAVLVGFLIGWMSYWAGFAKSLTIGLYVHHRDDLSQALIYKRFADMLDAGRVDEARSSMGELGEILRKQSSLEEQASRDSELHLVSDLLLPRAGLSLIRDYEEGRAKESIATPVPATIKASSKSN